jgi:pimeloyl-ACP methyl ester carboxylesterase
MFHLIIFAVLLLIILITFISLLIKGIRLAVNRIRHRKERKIGFMGNGILLAASVLLCIAFIFFTQITASTPKIRDEKGKVIAGSIAELRRVELNGRKEWISIRGYDRKKPILLFLAGGPGGSQMAAQRYELAELEKYFVVINWDQPGSGKSYGAVGRKELTAATYIEDGYALTKYLCEEFKQEKIFLLGESWGSALGIFLAAEHPELYHGVIGTGQMVAFLETEIIDYNKAMELAKEEGKNKLVAKLEANGLPPYYGKDVTWKSAVYLQYLTQQMNKNPQIHNRGYNTLRDLAAREYGILDKINFLRGIVNTFNHVYPQLYEIDLRKDYPSIDVPVYFFLGRHDINAPVSLAEEYYELLQAPKKEIVWFEHSGHSPWINESDRFVRELLRVTEESVD